MIKLVSIVTVVLVLQACTTTPPVTPGPAPASVASTEAALATERQWLQTWFKGTPVLITQRDDGPVSVDVPIEFCFDSGRHAVKPPLAAVLDKVAESLRRTPLARLDMVSAPEDATSAAAPLALQRAQQVRRHLLARGVPARQIGNPTASTAAAVQLRIVGALR